MTHELTNSMESATIQKTRNQLLGYKTPWFGRIAIDATASGNPRNMNGANSPTQTEHPNAMPATERLSLSTTYSSPAIFTANGSISVGNA